MLEASLLIYCNVLVLASWGRKLPAKIPVSVPLEQRRQRMRNGTCLMRLGEGLEWGKSLFYMVLFALAFFAPFA